MYCYISHCWYRFLFLLILSIVVVTVAVAMAKCISALVCPRNAQVATYSSIKKTICAS